MEYHLLEAINHLILLGLPSEYHKLPNKVKERFASQKEDEDDDEERDKEDEEDEDEDSDDDDDDVELELDTVRYFEVATFQLMNVSSTHTLLP